MNTFMETNTKNTATGTGLAVVGFVALVALGIWLAVYSTRFVPTVVNGAGAAAVYLGSVFHRGDASLSVVTPPTASSTLSSIASSTLPTPATEKPEPVEPVTTPGEKTTRVVQIGGTPGAQVLSGLPDLVVVIDAVGYLSATSTDSFVASTTVPANSRPAIKFTIKNIGTNATGPWCYKVQIPVQNNYIYESANNLQPTPNPKPEQSLVPGYRNTYMLGFDQANTGSGQTISISANVVIPGYCNQAIAEKSTDNNNASIQLTILGN